MDQDKIPLAISTSYGDDEFDWTGKHKKTDQDVDRINDLFKTQGLRGISLFFSSGDDGVASFTARGKSTEEACKEYHPEFPASSPFVTAVGGAQMGTDAEDLCGVDMHGFLSPRCQPRERVCSSDLGGVITGGGGFSTLFSRGKDTSYQNKVRRASSPAHALPARALTCVPQAVDHYLQHGQLPPSSKFHRKGRAYPDVTGIAAKFPVRINGTWTFLYGTSASTPMVASMVALINDARLNAGLPAMGFLNPFLYQTHEANPAAFNDVVSGKIACVAGHNASSTWHGARGTGLVAGGEAAVYVHTLRPSSPALPRCPVALWPARAFLLQAGCAATTLSAQARAGTPPPGWAPSTSPFFWTTLWPRPASHTAAGATTMT